MNTQTDVYKFSKTISPNKISSFLTENRLMLDEMETMASNTPVADQAYGAAVIFKKYGMI